MKIDWYLVNRLLLWKLDKRELNKSFSKTLGKYLQDLLACILNISPLLWTGIMLAIFHVSGKLPWLSEDEKFRQENVTDFPHNWIMQTEILWKPGDFVWFKDLTIEVISSFLQKRLNV